MEDGIEKRNKKVIMVGAALFNWSETQRMIEISMEMYHRGYQIVFLGEGKYDFLLQDRSFIREKLCADKKWYTPERIEKMLDMDHVGSDYAQSQEIEEVVAEEIALIQKYKPAAILTGYRMTLSVSARITKVKMVWCLSAVLSAPYFEKNRERLKRFEEDKKKKKDNNLTYREIRALYEDAAAYTKMIENCRTLKEWNRCLERYGAKLFRYDMEIYIGDLNLMSDARQFFPQIDEIPGKYVFIGPIFNSERIEMPQIVHEIQSHPVRKHRKKILVSFGSSGRKELLMQVLDAMRKFDFEFFISVIGLLSEEEIKNFPDHFHFCDKFPLLEVATLCDSAIIQGGQGTLYAVIAGNCPFLAFPATYEQRHNAENMVRYQKCGKVLHDYERQTDQIAREFLEFVSNPEYQIAMKRMNQEIGEYLYDQRQKAEKIAADNIEKLIQQGEFDEKESIVN